MENSSSSCDKANWITLFFTTSNSPATFLQHVLSTYLRIHMYGTGYFIMSGLYLRKWIEQLKRIRQISVDTFAVWSCSPDVTYLITFLEDAATTTPLRLNARTRWIFISGHARSPYTQHLANLLKLNKGFDELQQHDNVDTNFSYRSSSSMNSTPKYRQFVTRHLV